MRLYQTVLDTTDARGLAEFYRELLGYTYRPGDEPPAEGEPDPRGTDWLVLLDQQTSTRLAFQQVDALPEATWPRGERPQQLHLDIYVDDVAELDLAHERVLGLGGRVLRDLRDDPAEPLLVYADPAGHPFCVFTFL